ncbi:MAG: hypothetical protein HY961_07050 [Ignavibacteriae bacterium]|nr:hypothetical protein [Ignavibacteriota bacterium]
MKHAVLFIARVLLLSIAPSFLFAQDKLNRPPEPEEITGTPTILPINVNRILSWYNSNGVQEYPITQAGGMFYPKGTANAIYGSGLLWGGRVKDGQQTRLHVNGQTWITGMRQGAILGLRTSQVQSPNDSSVRLFRIRRDFRKIDLRQDAAETYRKNVTDVTNADLNKLRAAYIKDWSEWPWEFGAPFYDTGYLNANRQVVGANNGVLDRGEDVNRNAYLDPGEDVNRNGMLDAETPGYADADMVLWFVCNDVATAVPFSNQPAGMEMQGTIWAYNRNDALGSVIYKRFRLIYKGLSSTSASARIDSMYVAQVCDPDLGDPNDDYVGCDSTLNLGYVYNSVAGDRLYGNFRLPAPSAGTDFVQGPVVRGIPGQDLNRNGIDDGADYASINLQTKGPGYINLPMTAFIYFDRHTRNGSRYSVPGSATSWYQSMRGLPPRPIGPPDPPPLVNPTTLAASRFWVSGDPVLNYGWLDGLPLLPGERQYIMPSGPFTMAIGDTQEVVIGVAAGLGADHLSSIKSMKYNDKVAQATFNNAFKAARAPSAPNMTIYPLDKQILLDWGKDSAAIAASEQTILYGGYRFEGYNVYQVPDGATDLSHAVRVATFDLVNGIRTISQEEFDIEAGEVYVKPVRYGTDSGIQRSVLITEDKLWNKPLVNGVTYYYVVTAYTYTPDATTVIRSVESPIEILACVPESPRVGTKYQYTIGDTLKVTSINGYSDAVIVPVVYNPRAQTGDKFHVRFDTTTSSRTYRWNLYNATKGNTIYSNMTDVSGTTLYTVADGGFKLTIGIPPVGLRAVTDQNGVDLYGPSNTHQGFVVLSQKRSLRAMNGLGTTQRDYEMRFDGRGSYAIRMIILASQSEAIKVPFSVWDIGRGPDDVPVQVIPSFRDSGITPSSWNVTPTGVFFGDTLFKICEPIHETDVHYPTGGNDSIGVYDRRIDVFRGSQSPDEQGNALWGIQIADKDNDGLPPPVGTVIRFLKFHEVRHGDIKEIAPAAPVVGDAATARKDLSAINVFPNPFFARAVTPTGLVKKNVTFTHLPEQATIRIFTMGGELIRTLRKDDPASQFLEWDLKNEYDLPVASGIYIAHVEMPALGLSKVLKLAIIQGPESLNGF